MRSWLNIEIHKPVELNVCVCACVWVCVSVCGRLRVDSTDKDNIYIYAHIAPQRQHIYFYTHCTTKTTYVKWLIQMQHDSFISKVSCNCMGWKQLVGSLKWLVSFAKEPCEKDYILQKRPILSRSLLIVAIVRPHIIIWTSRVTREWVMSHMNESCHIWMSHVTYE